jgi:hypothetical protein
MGRASTTQTAFSVATWCPSFPCGLAAPFARLHANKPELLMVLDRPEIPLHTNGSERDIRRHVTQAQGQWRHALS